MPLDQNIGHYDMLKEKREAIVRNLSPSAKNRAFPQAYARPLPIPDPAAEAKKENRRLVEIIRKQRGTIEDLKGQLRLMRNSPEFTVRDVMELFCDEMNRAGQQVHEAPWEIGHLKSPRRSRNFAHPRHVCIWLVRRICPELSYPKMGVQFGGRDHTSIMHACKWAPLWLEGSPVFRQVANAVLVRFGKPPLTEAGA